MPNEYVAYRNKFNEMLAKFENMSVGHLGSITVVPLRMKIDKSNYRPIHSALHQAGANASEFERQEIETMLPLDVIEPTQTDLAALIESVTKKDGTIRFSVDLLNLNSVTTRISYPISSMNECINRLGDTTIFSTLDAKQGYWQVQIAKQDHYKTAFYSTTD